MQPKQSREILTLCLGLPTYNHNEKEDQFYIKKIQELEEKMRIIVDRDSNEIIKKTTMFEKTRSGCNRPQSLITEEEDDIGTKKKKAANRKKKAAKRKKRAANRKKMIVRPPVVSNHVTEELKEFITRDMKGSDVNLVIQKVLYASDLKRDQNRLSMPMNQLEAHEFLTADEKRGLERGGEMAVLVLGPGLRMHEDKEAMVLKIWHLRSSNNYVLKSKWNEYVKKNKEDLTEGTKIQVWSFCRDQHLCFAINFNS